MNIEKIQSKLKMNGLHFSECSVKRSAVIEEGKYQVDLSKQIQQVAEHTYNVSLRLTAQKKDFELLVVAEATFVFEGDDYSMEENVVHNNTVAIMYPYVRSQVTLMTSQPGMTPIVLPPINTSNLK